MAQPANPSQTLQVIGQGKHLRLVREHDGWEWVERVGCRDAVVVIATTADDELILIEEYRPPIGCAVISLPAGLIGDSIDVSDESPIVAGLRELDEETGFVGQGGEIVHTGPVSPGLTNERVVFVRVSAAVRESEGGGVEGESIVVHLVAVPKVPTFLAERCAAGCEIDYKVHAGLFWLGQGPQSRLSRAPMGGGTP